MVGARSAHSPSPMASPSDPQLANRILRGLVFGVLLLYGRAANRLAGRKVV